MDSARMQSYILVSICIFLFAIARIVLGINPVYSVLEPVFTRISEATNDLVLTTEQTSQDNPLDQRIAELEEENTQLRQLANVVDGTQSSITPITHRDLLGFEKHVWIGLGSLDGITEGQVALHDGSLFGVVERVFESSARVRTIFDPSFRSTVSIGDDQGVLKIDHGSLIVDLVPNDGLVGELVRTDGVDGNIRSGVAVGTLGAVVSTDNDVFSRYSVDLSYNVYSAEYLELVLDRDE